MTEISRQIQTPQQKNTEKLTQHAEVDSKLLFKATTVFPFKIFPCTVLITRTKLTISDTYFFMSKQVNTVLIEDIVRLEVEEAIFLASVSILDRTMNTQHLKVTHLGKDDAQRIRRIVNGIQIAGREGIDLTQVPDSELLSRIETLGTTQT